MFTRDERRAFLFLAAVTVAGAGARLARSAPPDRTPTAPLLPPGDLARQLALTARAESLALPLAPGEKVDVDRAPADELVRLPRIGPRLARRIAAERDANGPFGSLEALDRVPGIGPRVLDELRPWVEFSGLPRTPPETGRRTDGPTDSQTARRPDSQTVGGARVGYGAATPATSADGTVRRSVCPSVRLSLNTATAAELTCLPGIGPALAARIVADRAARGPYREVQELERVAGIGTATIRRLAPLVRAP